MFTNESLSYHVIYLVFLSWNISERIMKSMKNALTATALGLALCAFLAAQHHQKTVRIAAPFEIKSADPLLQQQTLELIVAIVHEQPCAVLLASHDRD